LELLNFVGGEFVPAGSQQHFIKYSPFDGKELAKVAASEAMDVILALQSAKKAFTPFRDAAKETRAGYLNKIAEHLEKHAAEIAFQEALHQGLTQKFVLENSVHPAVAILRKNAQDLLLENPPDRLYQASGLIGIITSWCLSLKLVVERLAPALAAGNVVMVKVSEFSPVTIKILGEALQAAEVPAGVVTLLQGRADVGQIIAGHPSIHAVTAVGKTATMESIAKAGLSQFKKLQLSGSAKNPALVLGDTDYKSLMPDILRPFLQGQGQMCWNVSRLFILESVAGDFLGEAKAYLENLAPLTSPEGTSDWTPLISSGSVAAIDEKIKSGVHEHGKVFYGGDRGDAAGFFYKPTVMLDLPNCSTLQQDELSGPLLLVTPVKYQHEMLKWANTSYLGHSAVVWGPSEKIMKVANSLECAQVWMNGWLHEQTRSVFGTKQSSFGLTDMAWNGGFYSDVKFLAGRY